MRGPAGFDVSDRFGFCPLDGGTLELSGVFAGSFSRCSRAVSRAVDDTTCSHSATINASFRAWLSVVRSGSGGTTMRGLNPASADPSSPDPKADVPPPDHDANLPSGMSSYQAHP